VLLRVPSAVVPETCNVLLNPEHPDARRFKVVWHKSYPWDRRLLE
jgi:RES domain-containing protein